MAKGDWTKRHTFGLTLFKMWKKACFTFALKCEITFSTREISVDLTFKICFENNLNKINWNDSKVSIRNGSYYSHCFTADLSRDVSYEVHQTFAFWRLSATTGDNGSENHSAEGNPLAEKRRCFLTNRLPSNANCRRRCYVTFASLAIRRKRQTFHRRDAQRSTALPSVDYPDKHSVKWTKELLCHSTFHQPRQPLRMLALSFFLPSRTVGKSDWNYAEKRRAPSN